MIQARKNWVDWMKVIGIFFIIWGHEFPPYMSDFIYAFNVPVFFLISGYLTKREEKFTLFLKKSWHTLLVPYLIISVIKRLGEWISHFDVSVLKSGFGILTGFHTFMDEPAATMMWFIYTLFVLKLLFQLFGASRFGRWMLLVISIVVSFVFNQYDFDVAWCLPNACLAMPFFLLGQACRTTWKSLFDASCSVIPRVDKKSMIPFVLMLFVAVYFAAHLNPEVRMFKASYGDNIFLFYLLALIGSIAVWLLSLVLDNVSFKYLVPLSSGTIIILGFHRDIANPLEKPIEMFEGTVWYDVSGFFVSIVVLLAFIPIIYIVKRYFPILLGRRSF